VEYKVVSLGIQGTNVLDQSPVKWFMNRLLNHQEFGFREMGPVMLKEFGEM
jgi:hypothetical protein